MMNFENIEPNILSDTSHQKFTAIAKAIHVVTMNEHCVLCACISMITAERTNSRSVELGITANLNMSHLITRHRMSYRGDNNKII